MFSWNTEKTSVHLFSFGSSVMWGFDLWMFCFMVLHIILHGLRSEEHGGHNKFLLKHFLGNILQSGSTWDEWRKRFNRELHDLYGDSSVIGIVKSARLRWAGHVARMDDNEPPRKVLLGNPGGQRRWGRPKLRWEDGVEEDVRKLGCRNWRMAARNRDGWRRIKEAARVHFGL
jgi:hypothetical protein